MQIPELAPPDHAYSPDGDMLVRVFTEPAEGERGERMVALWLNPIGDTVARAETGYVRTPFSEETTEKILARLLGQFPPGEAPSGMTPDAFRAAGALAGGEPTGRGSRRGPARSPLAPPRGASTRSCTA